MIEVNIDKKSLDGLIARSKALTLSRITSVVMLIIIIALILFSTWQRGMISGYEAEAARHHTEKEKKPIEQPMFRVL